MGPRVTTPTRRTKHPKRAKRTRSARPLDATVPLYLQVAHRLRNEIVAGTYAVGTRLPTEDELCARFRVSRHTIREALRRLREDNLVTSRQGAGSVVATSPAADTYAHDVMSINDLVSWSVGKRFAIEHLQMITADEELSHRLGIGHGESWLAVHGLGHEEGLDVPVCGAEYYIHSEFAAVGRLLHRHKGPIFPLLEDLFGIKVVEVHQTISATLVSADLANVLQVSADSAALEVQRSYILANGQIAQVTLSTHPAARYRHSMTLRRVKR